MGTLGLDRLGIKLASYRSGGGSGSSLLTGLVSYWKMDEASGQRNDVVGTNHLTDNNTVGSISESSPSGLPSLRALFNGASNESLTRASWAGQTAFTISLWFYFDGTSAHLLQNFVSAFGTWDTEVQFALYTNSGPPNFCNLRMSNGAGSSASLSSAVFSAAAWHHVIFWYDSSDKKFRLRLDNAAAVVSSAITNNYTGSQTLTFGNQTGPLSTFYGRLSSVGFWSRVPTTTEQDELWNGGAGKDYPFS